MVKMISRDDALNFEMNLEAESEQEMLGIVRGMQIYADHIKSLPGVKQTKEAFWIKVPSATHKDMYFYDCSSCKWSFSRNGNRELFDAIEWNGGAGLYCSHCGAKMKGVK